MAEVDRLIDGRPPDLNGQALNGGTVANGGLNLFVRAEQSAECALVVDVLRLPALLQTRDYATAVERTFPGAPNTPVDIDRLVDHRMSRQTVLDREPDPLKLVALVPWWVLRRTKGSRQTMVGQMTQLLALTERPNVDIRVLPDDPELIDVAASFTLLIGTGSAGPDVASADGPNGAIYVGSMRRRCRPRPDLRHAAFRLAQLHRLRRDHPTNPRGIPMTPVQWRKSTYSAGNQQCVELATSRGAAHIRDSKHPENGHLTFRPAELAAVVAAARAGELDDLAD
jgi:hypothetical protein